MPTNDNGPDVDGPHVSAQAQAALVLVESLIHGLIDRSVLTVGEGVIIIESAIEVQADVAEAADGAAATEMWRSHALLSSMATSLRLDAEG